MNPGEPAPALSGRLWTRLGGFFQRVRMEGVALGTGATVDFGHALEQLSLLNRQEVRDASRVTLAKSPEDLARVERAFDAFWDPYANAFPEGPSSADGALPRNPGPRPGGREPRRTRSRPAEVDRERELPVGIYSAQAPSPGHPLEPVSPRIMARYRTASRRFRRECATLPGRRKTARWRGDLDLPGTARRAARTAGEWVELARRARELRRADLVVLWDVSGSMREHDAALFGLIYALQRIVRSTRVFAFSTETFELTPRLVAQPYPRALEALRAELDVPGGGTQIAACLREFRQQWGASVRRTTTVLILSDGWDMGDPEGLARELQALRGRAHRVVWVNPYAARPGFAPMTGGMQAALPFVDQLSSPERFPASSPQSVRPATSRSPPTRKRLSTREFGVDDRGPERRPTASPR